MSLFLYLNNHCKFSIKEETREINIDNYLILKEFLEYLNKYINIDKNINIRISKHPHIVKFIEIDSDLFCKDIPFIIDIKERILTIGISHIPDINMLFKAIVMYENDIKCLDYIDFVHLSKLDIYKLEFSLPISEIYLQVNKLMKGMIIPYGYFMKCSMLGMKSSIYIDFSPDLNNRIWALSEEELDINSLGREFMTISLIKILNENKDSIIQRIQ